MFVLIRYFNRLKSFRFFHYLLFAEMLIGSVVLHMFLTIDWSIQHKFNEMSLNAENTLDNLVFVRQVQNPSPQRTERVQDDTSLPFSASDLTFIKDTYGDQMKMQMKILQYQNFIYDGAVETIFILFVSGEGTDLPAGNNSVRVGERAAEIIRHGRLAKNYSYRFEPGDASNRIQLVLENDKLTKTLAAEKVAVPNAQIVKLNSGDIAIDYQKTIVVPIDLYFSNSMIAQGDSTNIHLAFHFADDRQSATIKNGILQHLTASHRDGNVTFMFDTRLDQFRRLTGEMERISKAVSALSVFSLFIMGTGLVGLMIHMVQTRKKEIAICKSIGASDMQLSVEIILETLTLTLLPALLAVIVSVLLSAQIHVTDFEIMQSMSITLLIAAFSLFLGTVSFALSIYRMRKVYPVVEMKGE
jgi:ABC-type antimicrobial peptide transport system permease subunit